MDTLAASHVDAFGALLPDWTDPYQAAAELRTHTRACAIPSTLLALDEVGDWLGSVSLLQEDHEHIRQYSPLAGQPVRAPVRTRPWRRRGAGRALRGRSRRLGVGRLYLYCTATMAGWYRTLGWRDHDTVVLGPLQVQVMAVDLDGPVR